MQAGATIVVREERIFYMNNRDKYTDYDALPLV